LAGATCGLAGSPWSFAQSAPVALQRIGEAAGVSLILILSDINMPGMSGLELLPNAKALRPDVPVIMITAYRNCWRNSTSTIGFVVYHEDEQAHGWPPVRPD
jgi:CheY-like chemotaxis protein